MSPEQPPVEEPDAYSEDGVDLTLIRWMLSLTPAERLGVLQRFVNSVQSIRELNPDL
jgi:hypothetical protein